MTRVRPPGAPVGRKGPTESIVESPREVKRLRRPKAIAIDAPGVLEYGAADNNGMRETAEPG